MEVTSESPGAHMACKKKRELTTRTRFELRRIVPVAFARSAVFGTCWLVMQFVSAGQMFTEKLRCAGLD